MRDSQVVSPDDVTARLETAGYLPDQAIATVTFLGERLGKPILVEGPAEALAARTVKSAAHRPTFDALFDVYFPARTGVEPGATPRDIDPFLADLVERDLLPAPAARSTGGRRTSRDVSRR